MSFRFFESQLVAENYAKYRPIFPEEAFLTALRYFKETLSDEGTYNNLALAIDVGCGTGHQSTVPLAKHFDRVLGVDISEEQVKVAANSEHPHNITFMVSQGEAIPAEDGTASLIQSGIAAHWFNMDKFYKECDRVLAPGGVISIFCYSDDVRVVNHPNCEKVDAILKEIIDRPIERGFYEQGNNLVSGRYKHPSMQIPYDHRKRVDNIVMTTSSTVAGFVNFYRTQSPYRRMREAETDITDEWLDDAVDRLLKALGVTDIESPFTFSHEIFMLLGRKPFS